MLTAFIVCLLILLILIVQIFCYKFRTYCLDKMEVDRLMEKVSIDTDGEGWVARLTTDYVSIEVYEKTLDKVYDSMRSTIEKNVRTCEW